MKKRLLAQTCPISFPFNVLWTEPPEEIQLKNNSFFSADCAHSSIYDKMPLSLKAGSILISPPEIEVISKTFAGQVLGIHKVFKLKSINMKSTKTIRLRLLLLWGIFLMLLTGNNAFAQTKIIGRIINERTLAPASGATITVKNTNRFAVADEAGRFTIDAATGDVLVISMVGYVKKEIAVGKNNSVEVKLTESTAQLDDVVVIGYGKARRKDVTGAISSITGDDLRKTQPTTFDQALQGKVAG